MAGRGARRSGCGAVRPAGCRTRCSNALDRVVDAPVEPVRGGRGCALGGVLDRCCGGRRASGRAARMGARASVIPGPLGGAGARDAADGAAAGGGRRRVAVRTRAARCCRRAAPRRHRFAVALLDLGGHPGERLCGHPARDPDRRGRATESRPSLRERSSLTGRVAAARAVAGDASHDRPGAGRRCGGGVGAGPGRVRRNCHVRRQSRRKDADAAAGSVRGAGVEPGCGGGYQPGARRTVAALADRPAGPLVAEPIKPSR